MFYYDQCDLTQFIVPTLQFYDFVVALEIVIVIVVYPANILIGLILDIYFFNTLSNTRNYHFIILACL